VKDNVLSQNQYLMKVFVSLLTRPAALTILIFSCLNPLLLPATTYYVNDNSFAGDTWCTAIGNDGNNGLTAATPKATLQSVFNTYDMAPSDIIYVDKGNYTMTTLINDATDAGDATGYVSIIGAGRYATVITAPATQHLFDISGVSYIKITNMKLVSTQAAYYDLNLTGASSYCVVDNCVMTSTGTPVRIGGTSHYSKVQNSHITSTGGTTTSGILLEDCDNVTFYKDTIIANHYGLKLTETSIGLQPNYARIKECKVTVSSSTQADGGSIWLNHSDNDTIIRNKLSGGLNAVYDSYDSDDAFIVNNFIYNSARGIVVTDQASNSSTIRHNSFYTSGACLHMTPIDGLGAFIAFRVQNNIFYSTGNAAGDAIVHAAPSQALAGGINYNLYYNPNGARIGMYISTYYNTLAAWQAVDHNSGFAAGLGDENSMTTNPQYTNAATGALELTGNKQTGANYLATIPKDIYWTTRVLPVIGAWEDVGLLPVELLSFTGKCENNVRTLKWATATEQNSSHFILERSFNETNFETVATIPAAGSSTSERTYSANDVTENYRDEILYYRLSQEDLDGKLHIKGIISVDPCSYTGKISVRIFPNPSEGQAWVRIQTENKLTAQFKITDATGKEIYDREILLEPGEQTLPLFPDHLGSGIYTLQLYRNGMLISSEKLLKK
jgi:hypothetical protein